MSMKNDRIFPDNGNDDVSAGIKTGHFAVDAPEPRLCGVFHLFLGKSGMNLGLKEKMR